ncbi:MAG: argininosuccinate synthase [Dehalococcoidia bacterium]|nr:argininosuccinate synthase [Chloroflexi bacterium CFX7]MCK6565557.1 argininosuccinate synthase [Dehalococcoidia bacterium]NUQ56012.1 argininosuccinate synthase [Dehalococcoidia bacterium]RIL04285.1 MAG: argininosuccinate synthase [bacterium]
MPKLVLAYSGGLDTTTAIKWLNLEQGYDVIALNIDVGRSREQPLVESRGMAAGALKVRVIDAKEDFIRYFAFPALAAGAVYQDAYPLATALARPLMAKLLVDVAREEGATAVAHGCTGKGNDQVRFDVGIQTLDPSLKIVAPTRENAMARETQIEYLKQHGIDIPWGDKGPFSIDENIWGRSAEAGVLEDPWQEPPPSAYEWTRSAEDAPAAPAYIEVTFAHGLPAAIDGQELDPVALVERLNDLAGLHGVGRIDHIEDRLVGIKSREIYESPAAVTLHAAHRALEAMTLSRQQLRLKKLIATEYAELIYNGLWFSAHHQDLAAYVASTQRHVTGTIRLRLHRGQATVVGRKAPRSLYDRGLATYDRGDTYDQSAAVGFINIWGLQTRVQARVQLLGASAETLKIATPGE